MRKVYSLFILLICFQFAFANQPVSTFSFEFIQNKGQWAKSILYSTELPQGWLFLEKDRFTYNFFEKEYFNLDHNEASSSEQVFKGHALEVSFIGADPETKVTSTNKTVGYRNYLIGSDPARWAKSVYSYREISYQQLFPAIDLKIYTHNQRLKYDYIVAPNGNPGLIKMKYNGVDSLSLQYGRLLIKTSVNEIAEEKPYAYQVINGKRKEVKCAFTLQNNVVGFNITEAYNPKLPLIIDPEVVFFTYTGSTSGMSANCATADVLGNTYAAGQSMGPVYPITKGAFQATRSGSNVAICKFNAAGSVLLYATFLGGGVSEYPLGMVVNKQSELIILGNTSSSNFPTTPSAFDRTLGAQDYFISRISEDGTALLASTLLGGTSSEDGSSSGTPAAITLDKAGDIYIAGSTQSTNFPLVKPFQTVKKANSDGVIAKLNPALSQVLWSSYLGGTGTDIISDIKVGDGTGNIYVSGNTTSTDLLTSTNAVNKNNLGGRDGFVVVIASTGDKILSCSYLGTSSLDVAQLLALDQAENIYVAGYTGGTYISTPGTASTLGAMGGYFIHKLNTTLSATNYSVHLGNHGSINNIGGSLFIPTAFQVDDCGVLYLTAYAVTTCPVTPDAIQTTRRNLYLAQLSEGARELQYGTYFGSTTTGHIHNANHGLVTKKGVFHHIECLSGKTVAATSGAYSAGQTTGFDGLISKFHFQPVHLLTAKASYPKNICYSSWVRFTNNSLNATTYNWNFGDGTTESSEVNPEHFYQNPGNYRVRLIARNPANCVKADTSYFELNLLGNPGPGVPKITYYLCEQTAELDAGNPGLTYKWSTGATTQKIMVSQQGIYEVEINTGECITTQKITVANPLPDLQVPNIFTPNKDGKNDFLVIRNMAADTKLKVFNRWGKLIYQDNNYQNNWDGKNLSQGIYYYFVESPGSCTTQKGWVEINM